MKLKLVMMGDFYRAKLRLIDGENFPVAVKFGLQLKRYPLIVIRDPNTATDARVN